MFIIIKIREDLNVQLYAAIKKHYMNKYGKKIGNIYL